MAQWTPEQLAAMAALLQGSHETLRGPQPRGPLHRGRYTNPERLSPGWPWQEGSQTALAAIEGVTPQEWEASASVPPAPSLPPPVMAFNTPQSQPLMAASVPAQSASPAQANPIAQILMGASRDQAIHEALMARQQMDNAEAAKARAAGARSYSKDGIVHSLFAMNGKPRRTYAD